MSLLRHDFFLVNTLRPCAASPCPRSANILEKGRANVSQEHRCSKNVIEEFTSSQEDPLAWAFLPACVHLAYRNARMLQLFSWGCRGCGAAALHPGATHQIESRRFVPACSSLVSSLRFRAGFVSSGSEEAVRQKPSAQTPCWGMF